MSRRLRLIVVTLSTLLMAALLAGALMGKNGNSEEPYRHLSVFTEVLHRIKSDYVEEPDMQSVTLGAINGLLVSVDPFASYLNKDQFNTWQDEKGKQAGTSGLILSRKYGAELSVVDAIPGSPADRAELATGDIVEKINGISTRDMPLAYADLLLSGKPGDSVKLSVLQLRNAEPKDMELKFEKYPLPKVRSEMLPGKVGYVQVFSTEKGKSQEVAGAVRALENSGADSLVLDFRNAAEGDPNEGIAIADLFVDSGLLGYREGQKYAREDFPAKKDDDLFRGKLVVLTNRGTATGGEVAAAALQERGRAQVVGERTYGNAALRKAIRTDDGGAVILSVAKFYTPDGKSIQDDGVLPKYPVAERPLTDEELAKHVTILDERPDPEQDPILKRGLEILSGKAGETAEKQAGDPRDPADPAVILTPEKAVPKN